MQLDSDSDKCKGRESIKHDISQEDLALNMRPN